MKERSPEYAEAVRIITRLSDEERRSLRDYLTSLLSTSGALAKPKVDSSDNIIQEDGVYFVYLELLRFLQARGLYESSVGPTLINRLRGSSQGKGAESKCQGLWDFVCKQTKNRVERKALLALGFECHYDTLQWMDSVGLPEMLRTIDRVPASLDSQFPGYASLGILASVVRDKRKLKDK